MLLCSFDSLDQRESNGIKLKILNNFELMQFNIKFDMLFFKFILLQIFILFLFVFFFKFLSEFSGIFLHREHSTKHVK